MYLSTGINYPVVQGSDCDKAWEIALGSDKEFGDWLEAAEERSCFESEVPFAVTDRIVTLSTCSYEFDNARFVLVGRITE